MPSSGFNKATNNSALGMVVPNFGPSEQKWARITP